MSSPAPSKDIPILLHFLAFDESHGFYYVIEEKGDSAAPHYRRPRVETSDGEEDYAPPIPKLNQDEEVEVEDEDDEDYQDPLKEAEKEARAEALYFGLQPPNPYDSYSEEETPPKKSKLEQMQDQRGQIATENYSQKTTEGENVVIHASETEDYQDPLKEAEEEARAEALYFGSPSPRPHDSDAEEESPPKKSKLEQMEDQSGRIATRSCSQKTTEGEIFVIHASETDTIRPLQFPDLPFVPFKSDLLLVGERFYFVGGYNVPKYQFGYERPFPPLTDIFFWDSNVDKEWKSLPGPNIVSFNDHRLRCKAAAWAAGTFFVIGNSHGKTRLIVLALSSGDTVWKRIAPLPAIYIYNISAVNPLAVNGSKIFFQVSGRVFLSDSEYRNQPAELGAYFDVKSWKWEITGRWFPGVWSAGVVLYDAYLFSYGRKNAYKDKNYICVYSIERGCWLRRPVRGLKRDGNVLPDEREELYGVAAYLLQVNYNVLAFVWSRPPAVRLKEAEGGNKELCDVHCTKFVLHCTKDPRKKHPVFRAEVISYGNWVVEGFELQNCLLKHQSATT